tara:strand:+ start:168 stop:536 length:369 start_codon:yes stop_codon:yes gene_type:complete
MKRHITFIFLLLLLSCNKYSEKVSGNYNGQMSINDSIISNSANISISEVSKKRISITSDFFPSYQLDIDRQRYFSSVTYFHEGDNLIDSDVLEIGETGDGLYLTLIHFGNIDNKYTFSGERN